MNDSIDLSILENDTTNIFESIGVFIERLRLTNGKASLHDLIEQKALHVERLLQDLSEKPTTGTKVIVSNSTFLLKLWLTIVSEQSNNKTFLQAFLDNLSLLEMTIVEHSTPRNISWISNINNAFQAFSTSKHGLLAYSPGKKVNLNMVTSFFIDSPLSQPADQDVSKLLDWIIEKDEKNPSIKFNYGRFNIDKKYFVKAYQPKKTLEWDIEFKFLGNQHKLSKVGFLLWSWGEALQQINGVDIEIEKWGQGSLWVKIKMKFSSFWSQKEAQLVVNKATDLAMAKIDKPISETEKIKKEVDKLDAEHKLLLQKLEENTTLESKEMKALELRKLKAEVEKIEIENALKKIEGIEKLSELVAKGILEQDNLKIKINGQPFITVSPLGQIEKNNDLSNIIKDSA